MKKITLILAFLFASIVAFAQSGNIVAGQIDTANSIVAKPNLLAAYNNLKGWINLPIKVNSPYYYYSFGDSFTSGTGATLASNRYANLDAAFLGVPFTNRGISGTGAYNVSGKAYGFDVYGSLASLQIGLNDVRLGASTTSALTLAKIGNGVNNVITYHFIDSTFAAGSGTRVTTTGTWTTFNAQAVSGLSTSGLTASSSGATITAVTYGPTVVIGLIGTDGTIATYGSATITIDGTSYGTINENSQTDAITDGQGNNNSLMPFVKLYTGLSEGKHTVVLTTASATQFVVDYFGQLKKPVQCFPMVVFDIAYVNSTGQATYPSMTNTNVNSANAVIASDIATFTALGYPVFHAYTNTYYICATDASASDNLHPSDKGHRHIFQAFYNAISSLQNPFVQQDLRSTATPAFQNVSLNALTQTGIVYDAAGPVLATNSTDFNYGSNTAGYLGLGVSGVNADSKFRVLGASGAGLRIDYTGGGNDYIDGTTIYFRTATGAAIANFTSSAATFSENILPSTGGTYNLGGSSQTFLNGYFTNASSTYLNISGSVSKAAFGNNTITSITGSDINVAAATYTDNSSATSTTLTYNAANVFAIPTFASTNATNTVTNSATVLIQGAPVAGTNETLTNKYSLYVAGGASYFGGTVNNLTFTQPASTSTVTIASGSSFITSGAYSTTLTSTATTNATLPSGTGTLAYIGGTNTWSGANTFSATTTTLKHLAGSTSAPSIAAGTGAGTSPTVSVSGTDISGIVNITTGTSPSGSNAIVATVTFNTAYASAPKGVVLVPANTNAAALTNATQVFVPANGQTNGTTTTAFVVESNGTALAALTAYIWTYTIIQ